MTFTKKYSFFWILKHFKVCSILSIVSLLPLKTNPSLSLHRSQMGSQYIWIVYSTEEDFRWSGLRIQGFQSFNWWIMLRYQSFEAGSKFCVQNVTNNYLKPVVICQLLTHEEKNIFSFDKITFTFIVANQTIPHLNKK